ncbi:hypothetical protein MNBD_PLANCTO02-2111 [hydrothermal vent metagenome]|uniref:Uncharacterized protein n=1 Tax=hydrothermal vent metagenome TaxID=652676 RepID=A0A3B1E010_9ZZZZ
MSETVPQSENIGTDFNRLLKIGFWGSLFVAAGLFAVTYLAPSYVTSLNLKVERYDNQVKLVTLERSIQYLENSSDARKQNSLQVENNIPSSSLPFSSVIDEDFLLAPQMLQPLKEIPEAKTLGSMHYLELLANNASTRQSVMATATFILLFAFVFLQDSSAARLQAAAEQFNNGFRWVTTRYSWQKEIEEESKEEEPKENIPA